MFLFPGRNQNQQQQQQQFLNKFVGVSWKHFVICYVKNMDLLVS
jgi:hypothetical protein